MKDVPISLVKEKIMCSVIPNESNEVIKDGKQKRWDKFKLWVFNAMGKPKLHETTADILKRLRDTERKGEREG